MKRLTHEEYAQLDTLMADLAELGYNTARHDGENLRAHLNRLESLAGVIETRRVLNKDQPDEDPGPPDPAVDAMNEWLDTVDLDDEARECIARTATHYWTELRNDPLEVARALVSLLNAHPATETSQ